MAATSDDPRAFITDEVKESLTTPDFDMWHYSREQCVYLIEYMFREQGFVEAFQIEEEILETFLHTVRHNYHETPFHNFHHCFCVTQMLYCIIHACDEVEFFLTPLERLSVMVATIIHDLDHRGLNNNYHINSRSDLAINYNDQSVLENHHCATGFRILQRPRCNILQHLSLEDYKFVRKTVIACVLSTDMGKHFSQRSQWRAVVAEFNPEDATHREWLCRMMVCCSDISNEVRPWWVSRPWATNLMEEFFAQSDREKIEGLPVMSFMDRDQAQLEAGQVGFIENILRPLWQEAAELLPELQPFIERINENLAHWVMFMQHKRSQILLHVVEESHKPGISFNAGDVIVRMGEISSKMYFLRAGTVEVRAEDMTTVWDTMGQGAFFGEVGAFKGIPRTANIVAKTQCEILVVGRDDVLELLDGYPNHVRFIEDICTERLEKHAKRQEAAELAEHDLIEFAG
ncbi:cGMP phosphodiesterase [Thecamonas trahens ATCC 50062]|uniref:Phosphodiesterase n=1 Tax=Thecamonas trahens ATCC 50062 TaxID=461836 RepID=A0A0L0D2K4_THETB|nr:cGMP phosphodiesterase [Thecamonas trahens ATCC 50062]KNC46537.1 cGMP phosphodiesterase [Thecamonas trahens ATCC 50062]|eukprot:XP_013760318.1 cGMP phosphodiesterase [Thecamonas trahens ATCC 50062]